METTKLTKKQLAERVLMLEQQLEDSRERNKGFNKYGFIADLETEIKARIEGGQIENEDQIQEYIDSDLENAVIYYKDCFDICIALNATHFELEELGTNATDICQLAFYALREYVMSEIDMNEFDHLLVAKQEQE